MPIFLAYLWDCHTVTYAVFILGDLTQCTFSLRSAFLLSVWQPLRAGRFRPKPWPGIFETVSLEFNAQPMHMSVAWITVLKGHRRLPQPTLQASQGLCSPFALFFPWHPAPSRLRLLRNLRHNPSLRGLFALPSLLCSAFTDLRVFFYLWILLLFHCYPPEIFFNSYLTRHEFKICLFLHCIYRV